MSSTKLRAFDDLRLEKLSLWVPVIAVFLSVWGTFYSGIELTAGQKFFWLGIAATLFFNSTHVALTYSSMISLPEGQNWLRGKFQRPLRHTVGWGVLTLATLFLIFLVAYLGENWIPQYDNYEAIVFGTYDALLIWHAIGQSKGLSIIYNRKALSLHSQNASITQKIKRLEGWEVASVWTLVVSHVGLDMICPAYTIPKPTSLNILLMALQGLSLLMICGLALLYPKEIRRAKFVFSLRYFLWPLRIVSFPAHIAILALHGFEYLFVSIQMYRKSRGPRSAVVTTLSIATIAMFLMGSLSSNAFGGLMLMNKIWSDSFYYVVSSARMAFTTLHFWLDWSFFRSRSLLNKNTAAVLMLEEVTPRTQSEALKLSS